MFLSDDGVEQSIAAGSGGPVPEATVGDRIRLVLPAEPDYGRIARVATSSLALRLGFNGRGVEDLRLAVDETMILLLREDLGPLDLVFVVDADSLAIDASPAAADVPALDDGARRRFEEIVVDTVDEMVVTADPPSVRLLKRF